MTALDALGLNACIECGCCDYVCPSYIPLTAQFAASKLEFRTHELKTQNASHARSRFEARESRLQIEQADRDSELQKQVEDAGSTESMQALMERIKHPNKSS